MAQFDFILQKTYFNMGFFNVGISFERYFSADDNPVTIYIGPQKQSIQGRVSRRYNLNQTPRVFGGVELRNWFQGNFEVMDTIIGDAISENEIWIKSSLT